MPYLVVMPGGIAEWWGKIKGLGQKTRSNCRRATATAQCVKAIWGLPGESISMRLTKIAADPAKVGIVA